MEISITNFNNAIIFCLSVSSTEESYWNCFQEVEFPKVAYCI